MVEVEASEASQFKCSQFMVRQLYCKSVQIRKVAEGHTGLSGAESGLLLIRCSLRIQVWSLRYPHNLVCSYYSSKTFHALPSLSIPLARFIVAACVMAIK